MARSPPPLVQLRVGFVLTDLSLPGTGNLVLVPGSHHAAAPFPDGAADAAITSGAQLCCAAGSAVLFHPGLYHSGGLNSPGR
jgi:ectoine hydroxylase-related dioxygenase (phytanoyl-CoA dioxygenase family)